MKGLEQEEDVTAEARKLEKQIDVLLRRRVEASKKLEDVTSAIIQQLVEADTLELAVAQTQLQVQRLDEEQRAFSMRVKELERTCQRCTQAFLAPVLTTVGEQEFNHAKKEALRLKKEAEAVCALTNENREMFATVRVAPLWEWLCTLLLTALGRYNAESAAKHFGRAGGCHCRNKSAS